MVEIGAESRVNGIFLGRDVNQAKFAKGVGEIRDPAIDQDVRKAMSFRWKGKDNAGVRGPQTVGLRINISYLLCV